MAHPDTIMRQRFSDTTTQYQLAVLKGARFVGMVETNRGVKLDEAVVKQITGSDTSSARSPYGKPFTYRPQFKLWLSPNHKPEIPDGSEAIWDRLRLIPFTQRFEDGKGAETKLPEKLREELPGVLAWAVRGCVEWDQHGLGTAAAVERATAKYRAETDVIERFFEDACVFGPEYKITRKELFEAYEAWCEENGESPLPQRSFTSTMLERGAVKNFAEGTVQRKRGWHGISSAENPSRTPPEKDVQQVQNPCKTEGRETNPLHISEENENFSSEPPRVEGFENSTEMCSSAAEALTGPLSWDFDGGRINYMPEGE